MSDPLDKLDPADAQLVLQLIANARNAGISEISYRGLTVRFSALIKPGDQQVARFK